MKSILFFIFSIFFFFSCETEDFNLNKENASKDYGVETKATNIPDPIAQLSGVPVNIVISGQISHDKRYLSVNKNNGSVDLFNSDDNSGRQKWLLEKVGGTAGYFVKVYGGTSSNYQKLSFTESGGIARAILGPNNGLANVWYFSNKPNTELYEIIYIGYSPVITNQRLSMESPSSSNLIVSNSSMLNNWEIRPLDEYEFKSIEYVLTAADKVTPRLVYIRTKIFPNNTSTPIQVSSTISEELSETSSFSKTEGLSISQKVGVSVSVGVPGISNGQISTEISQGKTWSFQQSESKTQKNTFTDAISFTVPPKKTYALTISANEYQLSATYIATYIGKEYGQTLKLSGKWNGISCSTCSFPVTDTTTGEVIKSVVVKSKK